MADFLALTETQLISFAQNFAVKLAVHDGLRVRGQPGTETARTDLGTDMNPPFVDSRAPVSSGPPEERRYQGAYVDNDAITTDWSATLTVIGHS